MIQVTVVLGVDFWSGFGPVSAMKTGLFGPGNRTKSPVSAVKSGLFGPGNRTKSPVFQCDFGEKAENNQEKSSFSRREIELFEEVSAQGHAQGGHAGHCFAHVYSSRVMRDNVGLRWLLPPKAWGCVNVCAHIMHACTHTNLQEKSGACMVVAHQSENGIDDRARAAVSPSTGHEAAPVFRM